MNNVDFTSSLYLGMYHPAERIPPWKQFTTGKPAVLYEPSLASEMGRVLAKWQGCEDGLILTSTLHAFWDIFGMWSPHKHMIFYDRSIYPIGKWGVERAKGRGVRSFSFSHLDFNSLKSKLNQTISDGCQAVVVTDGWYTRCGKAAPLSDIIKLIGPLRGWLVIDDTQALGILGKYPNRNNPYGNGGGGLLKWKDVNYPQIIKISSLAKGMGVPVASVCSSSSWINRFKEQSEARIHSSPPSLADMQALKHAIQINYLSGDKLRERLLHRVCYFRQSMRQHGMRLSGGKFPVQHLLFESGMAAQRVFAKLHRAGIQTVMLRPYRNKEVILTFLLRADHTLPEIDQTVKTLSKAVFSLIY